MVAALTDWASKHFDLLASWFELSLSLAQGIGKSLREIYWFSYGTLKKGKISSPEEFGNSWSEFYEKATVNFAGNSRFFATLPKFINTLTEFIDSTNHLYQGLSIPFLPKENKLLKLSKKVKETADCVIGILEESEKSHEKTNVQLAAEAMARLARG